MKYNLVFSPEAKEDLQKHAKAGDKSLLKKIYALFREIEEHPDTGTGQIEKLKHCSQETWSRRISHKHRLCYRIYGDEVHIISSYGHYQEK